MGYNALRILWVVAIIVWCLICPILASIVASRKGYSGGNWFGISILFGVVGLIAAVGLPDKNSQDKLGQIYGQLKILNNLFLLSEQGTESAQHQEIVWEKDGSAMIYVPAGNFLMGSPEGEGSGEERPQHKVHIDEYYIDKYEVTNEQYAKFLNEWGKDIDEQGNRMFAEHPWGIRKTGSVFGYALVLAKHPVINVTWYGAVQYARWAGKRLPTEAEWERAARSGSTSKYYFGDDESGLDKCAWYKDNSDGTTQPVGQKGPNAWNIFDMSGNVWEWVSDYYEEVYYKSCPGNNPKGPSDGQDRVFRGGSWKFDASGCRSAFRNWSDPKEGIDSAGFRCAVSASEVNK